LSVEESREHQGKDRAADLLVVRFRSPEVEADEETGAVAGEDAVAWQVDDIEAWKSELGK
jgi:hypothetical protein